MLAFTEAKQRANKKYRDKFEYLQVRVLADEKEKICSHAEEMGESLNGFIRRAIAETMERDRRKECVPK